MKISVDRLQSGVYVRLPTKWNQHPFLLNRFKIKDQHQIDVIKKLNLLFVYYDPDKSEASPLSPFEEKKEVERKESDPAVIENAIEQLWGDKKDQIESLNSYRRRVARCEQDFERSVNRLRVAFKKLKLHPGDSILELNELVDDIVEKLLHEGGVALQLINGSVIGEDFHLHSLNVTIISVMIAKAKGATEAAIRDIAFAALVHDLGKMKIPGVILHKTEPLTSPEENYLRRHAQYGINMTNEIDNFPPVAKKVMAQHHERLDGSGYPEGIKMGEIDPAALIVAVADSFDYLCHPQVASEQKVPHLALSYLYKNGKDKYDLENLSILVKFMGVYPPGTIVELSNQMLGIVIATNSERTLEPEVLVYDENIPRHQATVIDIGKQELSIIGVIAPNKLSDEVRDYLNPRSRINYFFATDD